jgi:HrpA-like RNA helicase
MPLPVDAHRAKILHHIESRRVIIITGETGCGKSSRVPQMVLEQQTYGARQVRMMVSQPTRLAALGLAKRMSGICGADIVGCRMGGGYREEALGGKTQLWYVTTGYLVMLLAHRPDALDSHTHMFLDEVHQRSIHTDLLCMLARRLLHRNKRIKLVLMSATMHTDLYREYFGEWMEGPAESQHIFVGSQRCEMLSIHAKCFPSMRNVQVDTNTLALFPCLTRAGIQYVYTTSEILYGMKLSS